MYSIFSTRHVASVHVKCELYCHFGRPVSKNKNIWMEIYELHIQFYILFLCSYVIQIGDIIQHFFDKYYH